MGNVVFDYSALADAKSNAKKIVTGWNGIDDYKSGLNSKLKSPLDEWRLAKQEPYGHSYVSNAKQDITDKVSQLDTTRTLWIDLSTTIENFLQYVKDIDSNVVTIFETTSSQYTDYSGIGGFFNYIGDGLYNFFAVDLANCSGFTRTIADWGKKRADDLSYVVQQADDWFRHGNARYVLNIVGSLALTGAACAGVLISLIGIPFTGGASCTLAVGCISVLGVAAGTVSALIAAWDAGHAIVSNMEALKNADDPGYARFYGDITKYSEYVAKTDLGSKEANEKAEAVGKALNTTKAVADVIQLGTGLATTFGTKSVELIDDANNVTKYTSFDFSPSNVKTNVLKTFGFKVNQKAASVDLVEVNQSTIISNADEIGDTVIDVTKTTTYNKFSNADEISETVMDVTKATAYNKLSNADEIGDTVIDVTKTTREMDYKSAIFEKKVTVAGNGKKTVTKTATFNKASLSSEYKSMIASNNVVTKEFSTYVAHAEASSTVIDYTQAAKITPSKTIAAFQKASAAPTLENKLKAVESGLKFVGNGTSYLKASDENRTETLIQNIVKSNHAASQLDKYILNVDVSIDENKVNFHFGGTTTKKGTKLWKTITKPAV